MHARAACRTTMAGDHAGFSLIELMVTIAILAVLASFALPSMRDFSRSQGPKNAASDLFGSLTLARSEAIKRNASIDLVPNDTDWAAGWQVKVQSGGTLLRTQDAHANVAIASSVAGTLTYGSNGRLVTSATLFRITVPGDVRVRMRCVSVGVNGRPNVRTDTDTDQTLCN